MPTPINNQGTLSTDPDDAIIYTTPSNRIAKINRIIFNNQNSNYTLSLSRVVYSPDPVYTEPIIIQIYSKDLDAGDTQTDDNGYELATGNGLIAYSSQPDTTFIIDGFTESV